MPDDQQESSETLAKMIMRRDNGQVVKHLGLVGNRQAVVYRTKEGLPLLHVALLYHNHHAVRLLLDRGADPSFKDSRGRTALHAAAESDNVSIICELLQKCSVNVPDEKGDTALHVAVQSTSVQMVKWLVFAGADPCLVNHKGVACRTLTSKHEIRLLLRDYRQSRPPLTFVTLAVGRTLFLHNLRVSLTLCPSPSAPPKSPFPYYAVSHHELNRAMLGNLQDEDEVWSQVLEYCIEQPLHLALTFPLNELPDPYDELAAWVVGSKGCQDLVLPVKEIDHTTNAATAAGVESGDGGGGGSAVDDGDSSVLPYVARTGGKLSLDSSGLVCLICRPRLQGVVLGGGISGVHSIQSEMNPDVQLSVPADYKGQTIKGDLQVEFSPPVKEDPALMRAPSPAHPTAYECQTDYIKLRTADVRDRSTATAVAAAAAETPLAVNLPTPKGYTGGPLTVIVRKFSFDSQDSAFGSERRSSTSSSIDSSDEENEIEARRWTRKATFSLPPDSQSMTVPLETNKTLTVVEMKKPTSEDQLKRQVAKNYRKRRYKPALFFIAARPWVGERSKREVLVVVVSPVHLSSEMERLMTDGYCLLLVTNNFRVAPLKDFRVSVIDDLSVVHGDSQAVITFRHTQHVEHSGHHATFVLRQSSQKGVSAPVPAKLMVEQKRRRKAKKAKGQGDNKAGGEDSLWKVRGELHADLSAVGQDVRVPSPEQQELVRVFSDSVLLELTGQLPLTSSRNLGQRVGQRLGLDTAERDRVLNNPYLLSPVFKCFELFRRQRDRSTGALTYGQCVVTTLTDLGCHSVCEWLLKRLKDWPGAKELKG